MNPSNIPAGYVVLEVRIPKRGPVKASIIRADGSRCGESDDKRLIDGVLNGPVSGFGNQLGKTIDQGRTSDYWDHKKQTMPTMPLEESPEDDDSIYGPRPQEKELDQGYDV